MNLFQFDHVVHVVNKPEKAIAELAKYQLHAMEGGRHTGLGTYNTLSYFDLSYIEFLGTYDRELVKNSEHLPHSLIGNIAKDNFTEGLARVALRTTNIAGVAAHFKAMGLDVYGPITMSRMRPDGSELNWRLLFAGEDGSDKLALPFIIEWQEDDETRRADQTARGIIGQQPEGTSFDGVVFAVENADRTAAKWSRILQADMGKSTHDELLEANVATVSMPGGTLYFAQPITATSPLRHYLSERGEMPYAIKIAGNNAEQAVSIEQALYLLGQ